MARLNNGDEWQSRTEIVAWVGRGAAPAVDGAIAGGLIELRRERRNPRGAETSMLRITRAGVAAFCEAVRPADDEQGAA